jgi:hypothetical protein
MYLEYYIFIIFALLVIFYFNKRNNGNEMSETTEKYMNYPYSRFMFETPTKMDNLSQPITIDLISQVMNENQPPYKLGEITETAIYYKGTIPIRLRDWAHNQIALVLNGVYKGTGQPWKFTTFEVLVVQKDKAGKTRVSIEFFAENPDEYANRRFMIQLGYDKISDNKYIWRLILFEPLYSKRLKQILETELGTYGIDSNFVESKVNMLDIRNKKEIQLPGVSDSELETSPITYPKFQLRPLNTVQRELESQYNINPPSIHQEPCREEKFSWNRFGVQTTEPRKPSCSITNTGSRNWNVYPYVNPTLFVLDRTNQGLHGMFDRSNNIDGSNIKAL